MFLNLSVKIWRLPILKAWPYNVIDRMVLWVLAITSLYYVVQIGRDPIKHQNI